MAKKVFDSPKHIKKIDNLLKKNIPSYRKAYSDRTAWIMVCLSELAYHKFNLPPLQGKRFDDFSRRLLKLPDEKEQKVAEKLKKLADIFLYDCEDEKKKLEEDLNVLQLKCVKTFDNGGTQAILVIHEKLKFIALVFRGTEKENVKDIIADCRTITKICDSGGKIHRGFNDAFEAVAGDIQKQLNDPEYSEFPLFITGHSLGGALATIATKRLSHEGGIAACYTFGAPRVGDDTWTSTIKPPIYRVVNAADGITLLPPGDEIISSFAWLFKFISYFDIPIISPLCKKFQVYLLSKFGGYIHAGDMRYLSNCDSGNYKDVKLLPNVTFFRRIMMTWHKKSFWKNFLLDHSISIYRKKLMVIAEQRNQLV